MDYEKYEKECKRIRKANETLLSDFEKWLADKKLSSKTIRKHVSNIDFYINDFLLYEDALEARKGVSEVDMFLGYWFIKKAMWASKTAIREYGASLKKFYQFMFERDEISKEDLSDMKQTIKEGMPEWLDTMERYGDPDIEDMGEVWGF